MILDKENMFSEGQALTATALSVDCVDLGRDDAGPAEGLSLFVTASVPFTGAGTLEVRLTTADEMLADGSGLEVPATAASYAVANSRLVGGGKLVGARLPHGLKRYVRLNYVVTGALAGGAVTAGLVLDVQAE